MIKGSKICGIIDPGTLDFLINYPHPPNFIGFICNYPKSSRYVAINDLKKCLANSDVVISLWVGNEMVGFGRALTDGIFRGVLWDIVIDQNHQGKGFGTLIIKNLLSSKKIKRTKKLYLMTTNKKLFYSQFDFKEVTSQNLLIREI